MTYNKLLDSWINLYTLIGAVETNVLCTVMKQPDSQTKLEELANLISRFSDLLRSYLFLNTCILSDC